MCGVSALGLVRRVVPPSKFCVACSTTSFPFILQSSHPLFPFSAKAFCSFPNLTPCLVASKPFALITSHRSTWHPSHLPYVTNLQLDPSNLAFVTHFGLSFPSSSLSCSHPSASLGQQRIGKKIPIANTIQAPTRPLQASRSRHRPLSVRSTCGFFISSQIYHKFRSLEQHHPPPPNRTSELSQDLPSPRSRLE